MVFGVPLLQRAILTDDQGRTKEYTPVSSVLQNATVDFIVSGAEDQDCDDFDRYLGSLN